MCSWCMCVCVSILDYWFLRGVAVRERRRIEGFLGLGVGI